MTHKYVDAGGLRFAYLEEGTGPLVVLVHGFPDSAHTWDATMTALAAAGYRAIAPFTRGYHPTAIPSDGAYDTDTLGNDVVALIDALGGGPAIVVGHDWGASAAYAAAAIAPDKVKLLVTVAIPHPAAIIPTPRLAWVMRHFVTFRGSKAAAKLTANEFALVDELYRRWSPAWKNIPASETAKFKAILAEPGVAEATLGYYKAMTLRLPASLRRPITVPTVSFAGEHDNVSPRMYEKARKRFTASYEVVQVPGGHFMHREHPTEFITELVRVLADHAARPARLAT